MIAPMPIMLVIAAAFLAGGIPFGLLFVRWFARTDVRTVGSGNMGATNVRRAAGTPLAVAVLLCDVTKGALPVLVARWLAGPAAHGPWLMAATALAAIVGHMFPVYLRFRPSGKGVATALGGFLILAPQVAMTALAVFIILVAVTRRVSVGSLVGAVSLAPSAWLITQETATVACGILAAALIVLRHKDNLRRLRLGREPTMGKKR